MNHASPLTRCFAMRLLGVIVAVCWLGGCSRFTRTEIERRSVQDLFQEAVAISSQHAENTYVPQSNPPPSELLPAELAPTAEPRGPLLVTGPESLPPPPPNDQPRVTESFEETDVREALRLLASAAGVQIILDEKIDGVTSAVIEDQPFEQALDTVLLPLGLIYAKRDQQYIIGLPDPTSLLFATLAEHHEYQPLNQPASDMLNTLPKRLQAFARVADKRNLILIDAPRQLSQDILSRLAKLDRPVPQVTLEAIVCVVSPDSGFRFGVDWNQSLVENGATALDIGFNSLAFTGKVSPYGLRNATNDFALTSAFVKLLAQEGHLTIRAAPRVMAKDGEKAQISIARDTFFSVQPVSSGNNNNDNANTFFFPQSIQKVEAGIMLNITPTVRGDNVTVVIEKAEVSEDIRTSDPRLDVVQNPYPIINRRTVSTTVHVKDGHTIVIGGLVQKQTVDRVRGVPGLRRIPMLGRLFETVEKQEQEAEVVIFIAPRIVYPPVMEACEVADQPATHETLR